MPGYRLPAASASAAEHHDACKSSLAREMQAWKFSEAHGIDGLVAGAAAERGTDLHSVAAQVPFASPDFGVDPFDKRLLTDPAVKALGYGGYEGFIVADWVRRRDDAINFALDNFPGGRGAVQTLELILDEKRLEARFGGYAFSGLPDVLVIARGEGHASAVVVDYKSGHSQRKTADENRQIAALVGLVKLNHPEVQEAYASIIAETDLKAEVALAHYGPKQLADSVAYVQRVAENVGPALKLYLDGKSADPSPAIDDKLNEMATPGVGCMDCRGKTCCRKIQEKLTADYFGQIDLLTPVIAPLLEYKTLKAAPPMTPEKLSDILALTTAVHNTSKLYTRLRDDAETLTLQLADKGVEVPGVGIELGTARIGFVDGIKTIGQLHSALEPVLAGQTIEVFTAATVRLPLATAVRGHLAAIMSVPETQVEETLNARLGEATNPLKKGAPPRGVIVTRDLADILDLKRAEILGAKAAPTIGVSSPVAPAVAAVAPAVAASPATTAALPESPAVAPVKRTRRPKVEAPSVATPAAAAVPAVVVATPEVVTATEQPEGEAAPATRRAVTIC